MSPEREDDLVVLIRTGGDGEAFALAALLDEAGIEALVVEYTPPGLTGVLGPGLAGAVLRVREGDRERARRVLEDAASVDIDWDEVDLGDRDDRLPLHRPGRMPIAARIAFVVAVIVVAAGVVAGVLAMIQMMRVV